MKAGKRAAKFEDKIDRRERNAGEKRKKNTEKKDEEKYY
jgi:hypothetical protein